MSTAAKTFHPKASVKNLEYYYNDVRMASKQLLEVKFEMETNEKNFKENEISEETK